MVGLQSRVLGVLLTCLAQLHVSASQLLSVFVLLSAHTSQLCVQFRVLPLSCVCGLVKLLAELGRLFSVVGQVLFELIAQRFVLGTKGVNFLAEFIVFLGQGILLDLKLLASLERDTQLIGHVIPFGAQTFLLDFEDGGFAVGAIELRSEGLYSRVKTCSLSVKSRNLRVLQENDSRRKSE